MSGVPPPAISLALGVSLRTWGVDGFAAARSRLSRHLTATITWGTGVTDTLQHCGAWRDAYVCEPRKLVIKIHLATGSSRGGQKGSAANRGECQYIGANAVGGRA